MNTKLSIVRFLNCRLYGLITVLGSMRNDLLIGALPAAVVNGDDLSTALLLRLVGAATTNSTESEVETIVIALNKCIELAEQLGYAHVQERLRVHVKQLTSVEKSGVFDHSTLPIYNDFPPFEMNSWNMNTANATGECKEKKSTGLLSGLMGVLRKKKNVDNAADCDNLVNLDNYGGYHPLRVNLEKLSNVSGDESERICKISRVHICNISVKQFHRLYVRWNTPVLLQTDFTSYADRWKLSAILEKYGHVNVRFN